MEDTTIDKEETEDLLEETGKDLSSLRSVQ